LFLPLRYINPDKFSETQYKKISEILSGVLTENDDEIDPYGSVKNSVLVTLSLWSRAPKVIWKGENLLKIVKPLLNDKRFQVAWGARMVIDSFQKKKS
jgi:hypothetical protein